MIARPVSYENNKTTWSSKSYYEIGLIGFILGITNSFDVFKRISALGMDFVIPYIIVNIILGIPLVILELSLSQYGQKDMLQIWSICPIFKGMGYVCILIIFVMQSGNLNYLAFSVRYMMKSLSQKTEWNTCSNEWNTGFCYTIATNISRRLDCYDTLGKEKCDASVWESSFSQYFTKKILYMEIGILQWKNLFFCLLVTLFAFILTSKGIRFVAKVMYCFLIIAGLQFFVLFYVSLIHPGSGLLLKYFLSINLSVFKKSEPWLICIRQVIISTAIGSGGLRTLGSQNKFRGHSYRNGMMIILVDTTVSVLYLSLYVSLIGNLSYFGNLEPHNIFKDKEDFLFAKLPRMIQTLDGPKRLWLSFYFSHLFLVVLSNVLVYTFVVVKTIFNWIPRTEKYYARSCFLVYLSAFVLGIPFFSAEGDYMRYTVLGKCVRGAMILFMSAVQTTVIIYIYGLHTAVDDIHFMLGFRIPKHWQVMLFFSPIFLWTTWFWYLLRFYDKIMRDISFLKYTIMHLIIYSPLLIMIGYALWHTRRMILKCKWENVFRPDDSWNLIDPILIKSRQMFSSMSMTKEYLYRQSKRREIENFEFNEETIY